MVDVGKFSPADHITARIAFIGFDGQTVEEVCDGQADAVAAWMRAVANRLDPPKSVPQLRPPTYRQGGPI